jgi:hypothetical protein
MYKKNIKDITKRESRGWKRETLKLELKNIFFWWLLPFLQLQCVSKISRILTGFMIKMSKCSFLFSFFTFSLRSSAHHIQWRVASHKRAKHTEQTNTKFYRLKCFIEMEFLRLICQVCHVSLSYLKSNFNIFKRASFWFWISIKFDPKWDEHKIEWVIILF